VYKEYQRQRFAFMKSSTVSGPKLVSSPSGLLSLPSSDVQLQSLAAFLAKSDGKEKLLTAVQYACMFVAAGTPGNAAKIQASVAAGK